MPLLLLDACLTRLNLLRALLAGFCQFCPGSRRESVPSMHVTLKYTGVLVLSIIRAVKLCTARPHHTPFAVKLY